MDVSNREPYSHEQDDDGVIQVQSAAGGLTSALDPVMQSRGGTWVAGVAATPTWPSPTKASWKYRHLTPRTT